MDNIRNLLEKWLRFKGSRTVVPPLPKNYRVDNEEDYREDEIAFIVGLEEGDIQ